MSTSSTIAIPDALPADVLSWSVVDVVTFLNANNSVLAPEHIGRIAEEEVRGIYLVDLTIDDLTKPPFKMKFGPALDIIELVARLKVERGMVRCNRGSRPREFNSSFRFSDPQVIRSHLAIAMSPDNKAKPTSHDLDENDITLEINVRQFKTLPNSVNGFMQELTNKAPYTLNETKHLIEYLKAELGDEGFKEQFTDDPNNNRAATTKRELLSYLGAMARVEDGREYHPEFTALANEVCLAAVIVDPAIAILGRPYNRDRQHAYIDIKSPTNAELVDVWYPRNDFHVAYKKGGLGYGILHGDTDSKGQSEGDAMYKNALICLHSWKMRNEVYGESDPVILYAYVSILVCSMYIFFRDESEFKFRCILKGNIYGSKPRVVEFLRILHNFAMIAGRHNTPRPLLKADKLNALKAIPPPPSSSERKKEDEGPRKRPHAKDSKGVNLAGPGVRSTLATLGYTVYSVWSKRGFMILDKSNHQFAAKRTGLEELEILKYLGSASSLTYHNHTIPITNTLPLGKDQFLVIMPFYPVLSMVESLTKEQYYHIRFQLVEAIAFIHDHDIVHGDIKPENLVFDFTTSTLYVIDYDLSRRHLSGKLRISGFIGTEDYTAPEVEYSDNWDPMPAEVWAVAKTLKELAELAHVDDSSLGLLLSEDPSLRPTAAESFKQKGAEPKSF